MNSDSRYLDKLTFDPKLRDGWLAFFVKNFRVVILLIILISIWGVYSFMQLPRESNPEVKIPIAVVTTIYQGASPADIEELVTKKLETGISSLSGLKKVTSNSMNSVSAITVEFDAKQDLNDSIRKLRDKVNTAQKDLPSDAKEPTVIEISFDDTPIWTAVLTGPYDGFTMRRYGDLIKDELEKIPGVREIKVSGGDEREFEVAYDPAKLMFYGISAEQSNSAIKAANLAVPAGNFEGKNYNYSVRSDSRFYTADALGKIAITTTEGGATVLLRDLASVSEKAIKKTIYSRLSILGSEPRNAVRLDLVKRTGGNIVVTADTAKATVEKMIKSFGPGVTYDTTTDQAKRIRHDFNQLGHDFVLTLILVFGILFLIVGLKEAFVAGLAIPLVFFATFGVMYMTGISLNFLSMFSLILSLGLLVDDAIVVVSATKQYLRTGKFTPEEAVLLVLNDFKVVLTTTTLTTVWAFLPLLMASGIMGQFIKSIPITVSVTLIASLLIALMVNHPLAAILERIRMTRRFFVSIEIALLALLGLLVYTNSFWGYVFAGITLFIEGYMIWWFERGGRERLIENEILSVAEWKSDELIKKKLREQGSHVDANFTDRLIHGIIHFNSLLPLYEKYLRLVIETAKMRKRVLGIVGGIFLVAMALPVVGIVQSEFFPAADYETIFISIEAPNGLKLDNTDAITREVESRLLKYPEIVNFSTVVGNPGASPSRAGGGTVQGATHLASVTVTLKDKEFRKLKSYDVADLIRKDMSFVTGATINIEAPRGGPPSGAAFEAHIAGDDLKELNRIAHELAPMLSSISGVINTDVSVKDTAPEYTFALDPVKLEEFSLNGAYVGSALRTAISGSEITTVIKDNKEIKVMARFAEDKIPTLESIQNLQIVNMRKQPVFLKDVATIELRPAVNGITRINQKRTIILSSGITAETSSTKVLAEFQKKFNTSYKMPDGYVITFGGENEQNTESVMSILRAMVIAMLLIVSTLIIQFNSFRKATIVLVTLPLALIGVFFGMALFNLPLSFPGLIGILALFGIVVKNAIILIDKINLNLSMDIPFMESIVDAGKSRLEAIFITSISTICGIIPITLSNETWMALGGAVIFGLALSSFLTLFIVPILFVSLVKKPEEKEVAVSR